MKRILVVDDDPATREVVQELLESFDYAVASAGDGVEALELIRREPPDILLLDLRMPRMNGREVLEALRADPRGSRIPVVILSASGEDAAELAGRYGAQALGKPISIVPLLATIQELEQRSDAGTSSPAVTGPS
jgi:CheY-like chemotaxis protein